MTILKILPFFIYKVSGNSMMPEYIPDQKVLGVHWFVNLKKGDVVIAQIENREIIKRIVQIKNNKIWIEGDNKKESRDSRTFGWVDKSKVIAKVGTKLS